jgi:predicted lactoylglutathione lyase
MTKELWINLPVKDVKRSREFFTQIGFSFSDGPGNSDTSAPLIVGSKNTVIMLFEQSVFRGFLRNEVTDSENSNEVLFSFSAESPDEVDEISKKVTKAGGVVFAEPAESQGWMYGCGFADPDGHRWNALFMDTGKLNK